MHMRMASLLRALGAPELRGGARAGGKVTGFPSRVLMPDPARFSSTAAG